MQEVQVSFILYRTVFYFTKRFSCQAIKLSKIGLTIAVEIRALYSPDHPYILFAIFDGKLNVLKKGYNTNKDVFLHHAPINRGGIPIEKGHQLKYPGNCYKWLHKLYLHSTCYFLLVERRSIFTFTLLAFSYKAIEDTLEVILLYVRAPLNVKAEYIKLASVLFTLNNNSFSTHDNHLTMPKNVIYFLWLFFSTLPALLA